MTSKTPVKIPEDIKAMSFEAALAELEKIVDSLEDGEVPLEKSIDIYQRGNLLRAYCDNKLREAQMKIEKITEDGANTAPLDAE